MPVRLKPSLRRDVYVVLLYGWVFLGLLSMSVALWIKFDAQSYISRVFPSMYKIEGQSTVLSIMATQIAPLQMLLGFYIAASTMAIVQGLLGLHAVRSSNIRAFRLFMLLNLLCALSLIAPVFYVAGFNKAGTKQYVAGYYQYLQRYKFDGMFNSTSTESRYWYSAQQKFQCCGLRGPMDYMNSTLNNSILWHKQNKLTSDKWKSYNNSMIPAACCLMQNDSVIGNCPTSGPPTNLTANYRACYNLFVTETGLMMQTFVSHVVFLHSSVASCFMHMAVIASVIRASIIKMVEKRTSIAVLRRVGSRGKLQLQEVGVTNVVEDEPEDPEADTISIATADFAPNRLVRWKSMNRSYVSSRASSRGASFISRASTTN